MKPLDPERESMAEELAERVREFENSEMITRSAREKSELCRDYFDDKQLTDAQEKALKERGQPIVVFNEIKPKVKTMLGLEKQTRKDPRAFPRNPDDEDAARAATDAIRFVCDSSNWDDKRSKASRNLVIEGTGAIMVGAKEVKGGLDPDIRYIPWDRFYADSHSNEDDFCDAAFKGIVIWMDLDEAQRKYPEARDVLTATWQQSRTTETYEDKPRSEQWADYKRKRVRLCEHYYNDGGWKFCIFTSGGFVVEPMDSPYEDENGKPECPIHAISLYVDRDNNRYGEVQAMLSPQDEINKRRSKALHLISTRQVRVSPAVSTDADKIRKELARPDGVFIGERDDVEVLGTNDMAMGNLNLMQDAREHIHRTGANNALSGKDTSNQSGRAIVAQQQGGMTESADFLDCVRRLSLSVYRAIWNRVRQYWKAERWIRVTDNENNVKFVGLNRPITALQAMANQMGVKKEMLPQLQAAAQQGDQQALQVLQALQAFAADPRSQQVVATDNNVTQLDVDIIVDEGIDTPSVQAEQFDTLAKMLPALGPFGQSPEAIKMLIQASSLRDKQQLLETIEKAQQGQPQPDPQQMMEAQAQAAQQQAQFEGQIEIEKAKIGAAADIEVAKIKAGADSEIKTQQLVADSALSEKKALLDHEAKVRVAEATGQAAMDRENATKEEQNTQAQMAIMAQLAQAIADMNRPRTRTPIRDENGMIVGVQEMAA